MAPSPVELFQEEFRRYVGSGFALAVSSGSTALQAAILGLDLPKGSSIITTPFTFPATANYIIHCGHKPIFVDVVKNGYNIDPDAVQAALDDYGRKVSAAIIVHLFGEPCNVEAFTTIQRERRGFKIIEDASQAVGRFIPSSKGKRALGTIFDVGTYSFYASKNLWTYEGGMVVTDSPDVAERIKMIRNHGFDGDGEMPMLGYNFKMPWICAFQGWQMLLLHKKAIESELGAKGPHDGYYTKLVYDYKFYRDHPDLWEAAPCPNAEAAVTRVKGFMKGDG